MDSAKEFPKVFIGASLRSVNVLRELQNELTYEAQIVPWQHIFHLNSKTLVDLLEIVKIIDFCIFVFTPDDKQEILDPENLATREHVIFELGLFIGGLGKDRCFFIVPSKYQEFHLFADLLDTEFATFDTSLTNLRLALEPACNCIRDKIKRLGILRKSTGQNDNLGKSLQLQYGLRTVEKNYYQPILKALYDLGGSAQINDVLERVEQSMKGVLKPIDYEPIASGTEIRWRKSAQWARNTMVKKGLLKSNSSRGIWEISEIGRKSIEN